MEPILTIDNLNSFGGNMLRQGDKSQLKYRLRDVGNKNLAISSKPCQVRMYGRNYTTVVYETTATVSSDNTVTFTIDKVLPKGTFYLEFTVGDYIFPTDHKEFFEITPSGKGMEANIIEIVGVDAVVRKAVDLINEDPSLIIDEDKLVTDIISNTGIGNINEYYKAFNDLKPKAEQSISQSAEALTKSQNALNVANGIDAKATNALNLSKSADTLSKSVQEQFNQVVIDGDSSVEAAQARVDASGQTNPTLKARLDKEHNEVTAQLAQKPTKGEVNINHFDEETRQTFLDAQGIDVNYVLGEGNVMPFNTTFFKHGKNLYNKDTATQDRSISTFSGNLATNVGHVTSDFIKIDPSKVYAISPIPSSIRLSFYDSNYDHIAGTGLSDPTNPITPPDGAVFLRYSSTNQNGRQLEEGSSPTAFEPYTGYYYDEGYIREGSITPEKLSDIGADMFANNSLTPNKMSFFRASKNLYNKATSTPDRSISVASGNLATNVNNTTSDFIPVESGEYYSLSPHNPTIRLAFYDSYKNFISGLSDPANPILVPGNGAFVRYSYSGDFEDVRQFEKGQTVTSYEPYYESAFDVETIRNNSIPLSKLKGGVASGDSNVSTDEIIVDMKSTRIEFYIKGSNPDSNRYLKYSFKKEERDFDETRSNGNLNAWRLVDLFEVERTGDFTFTDVYPESFTTDGVWEFALKEKGQPQFMGGGHGNEVMTNVFMLVDGIQKELGTTEQFKCKNIKFVQKSTIYRVFTQEPVGNTVKSYDINAKDGIKITGEFDWIESIILEGGSFFPMFPIKRTLADSTTQITDRFVRDSDYDIKDISTTSSVVSSGASEPLMGITESNMWGQESGLSIKITSLEKAKENQTMYISPSSLFNKFYYQIIGESDYTVKVGEKMKSAVLFKINTVN